MFYLFVFWGSGPTLRAADAAGAAPELGAILGRRGTPPLVPVGGGRQRRRWRLPLGRSPSTYPAWTDRIVYDKRIISDIFSDVYITLYMTDTSETYSSMFVV